MGKMRRRDGKREERHGIKGSSCVDGQEERRKMKEIAFY